MTPDVVVDIGNSRVKWGRCERGRVVSVVRLSLDDSAVWDAELAKFPPCVVPRRWAVASVNPPALRRFLAWASRNGDTAVFEQNETLPIRVNVDEPAKVGIDRLLGAIAARALTPPGTPAITVDVGTAVTVNLVDGEGIFQGGAIFPGPRLMARALHKFTAKLPFVEMAAPLLPDDPTPGKNTAAAMRLGLESALGGGVQSIIGRFVAGPHLAPPWVFATGGAHHLLAGYDLGAVACVRSVPALILEGIRIAAETLP